METENDRQSNTESRNFRQWMRDCSASSAPESLMKNIEIMLADSINDVIDNNTPVGICQLLFFVCWHHDPIHNKSGDFFEMTTHELCSQAQVFENTTTIKKPPGSLSSP